jgi:hypothetical protein
MANSPLPAGERRAMRGSMVKPLKFIYLSAAWGRKMRARNPA